MIIRTKQRKAPEGGNIANSVLKRLTTKVVVTLTNRINSILRLMYFSSKRKHIDVIMLPSRLPAMRKIAKRVLANKIQKHTKM